MLDDVKISGARIRTHVYGSESECAISTTPLRLNVISVVNVTTHSEDHKRQEEWIQYAGCSVWVHECCGEKKWSHWRHRLYL